MKLAAYVLAPLIVLLLASCAETPPADPLLEKAQQGDPHAQFELAERALGEDDYPTAMEWLSRSQESGYAPAIRRHATLALERQASRPDAVAESLARLEALAENGDAPSHLILAERFQRGQGVVADPERAARHFQAAAELGDHYARYRVLLAAWEKDPAAFDADALFELKKELYRIATGGEPRAFSLYARILDQEGDIAQADKRHLEAAQAGEPFSMYRIGLAYHRHVRDPAYGPLGFEFLSDAEAAGVAQAVFPLAKAHYIGNGVNTDEPLGLRLALFAAWLGDSEALEFALARYLTQEEPWNLDTRVEIAALVKQAPPLKPAFRQRYHGRIAIEGRVFDAMVDQRLRQRRIDRDAYLASRRALLAEPLPLEQAMSEQDPLAPFADDRERYRRALLLRDGPELYQIALERLNAGEEDAFLWLRDAVDARHPEAGIALYERYLADPQGVPVTADEAILALQSANLGTHPVASLYLAREYRSGERLKRDLALAARSAEDAYRAGNTEAFAFLKTMVAQGEGIDMASTTIRGLVEEIAAAGNADAQFLSAGYRLHRYLHQRFVDKDGVRRNPVAMLGYRHSQARLVISYRNAVEDGFRSLKDAPILFEHAYFIYENPESLPDETQAALDQIWTLADREHPLALQVATMWLLRGYFVEADADRAAAYYQKGDGSFHTADMKAELAHAYMDGHTTNFNVPRASILYREAAVMGHRGAAELFHDLDNDTGNDDPDADDFGATIVDFAYRAVSKKNPDAMLNLALAFDDMSLFNKEYSKSQYIHWLGESAKSGNTDALVVIGNSYMTGHHVDKNPRRGLRFLQEAADRGDAEAQYYYGFYLATGAEIQKDLPAAMTYLNKAADQEYAKAKRLLANISLTNQNADLETPEESSVLNEILASVLGHDTFPHAPYLIKDETLVPVVGVGRNRPLYMDADRSRSGDLGESAVLLAGDAFHPARITIEEAVLRSPFVRLEQGFVYTGQDAGLTLDLTADTPIVDGVALLLIRDGYRAASYHWKNLPSLEPQKSRKLRFNFDETFVRPKELALYFFAGGNEIPHNARQQVQPFLTNLTSPFPDQRKAHLKRSSGQTVDAAFSKDFKDFFRSVIYLPLEASATFAANDLGYLKAVTLPETLRPDTRRQIFETLPFITLLPRIEEGAPVPTTVTLPISN